MAYDDMTIEELEELSGQLKAQLNDIREQRVLIARARAAKIARADLSRRLRGVDLTGVTDEDVAALAAEARATPSRPGDVVVAPLTAVLTADTSAGDVS